MVKSWRPIFVAAVSAAAILAASLIVVRHNTDYLLRSDATSRAQVWAANLTDHVADLPEIVGGAQPSDESVVFFEQARAIGDVWKYQLYDATGQLILVSNQIGRTHTFKESLFAGASADLSRLNSGEILVSTRNGGGTREPRYIAEAIVPIILSGKPVGFLKVFVDESQRQDLYFNSTTWMALTLGGLIMLAFGVPAAGFLMRSRQKEEAENRLQHLAYHDSLTGLKNRLAISQSLEMRFAERGPDQEIAIHILDLDKFKDINDTLGHDCGDEVLRQASSRIAQVTASEGVAGRLGGDEFLIIQSGRGAAGRAEALAQRLVEALRQACTFNHQLVETGVSIGSAIFPADGSTPSELMKSADIALYFAKAQGRGCYAFFRPEMDEKVKRRRAVETKLRAALASDGFLLHFQPLFNLASGAMEGVEALLRLPDGPASMVPPVEFIPIAEEAGLIDEIGTWVIFEGCRSLKLLPGELKLALNLSPIQFEKGDIVQTVAEALRASGAEPGRLELEITENLLLKDSAAVQAKIAGLTALGVSIALDDFGAGYSSLGYLWRYPFDKIKIDRSFVSSLGSNANVEGIVETIILLGRKLKMRVTAEGVETAEQAAILRALKCDQVQGYLFGKPMPMADLAAIMLQQFIEQRKEPLARADDFKHAV